MTALDPRTGRILKQGRLSGDPYGIFSSPVAADGKIYVTSASGMVTVVKAGTNWTTLHVNELDEEWYASPAIADSRIYIRTRSSVYALAKWCCPVRKGRGSVSKLSEICRLLAARPIVCTCAWIMFFATVGGAQAPDTFPSNLFDLPRLKTFSAHRASSDNRFVRSNDDSKRIMPGETLVMADLRGPGVVNHVWITVADNEYAWPRLLRLRVYYDGKKTPSVDVPLGDFFGVGHGYERDLDSLPIRNSSFGRARNSYWPMPFGQACKITVTDEGKRPVTAFYYHVDWQKHAALTADIVYFHGYYRQERPAVSGRNYEFLNVRGTGHYVGTVLNVIQAQVGWFGEGDDLFYVDGAKKPQIYGTGTEDYINEAWGLRVSTGPWTGTPVAEGERVGARLTGYRWHVPDPVPFTKSLWAGVEHTGWTYNEDGTLRSGSEERPDYFSSAALWYQKGVNEEMAEPPYGEDRLPLGNAQQIAVEDSLAQVTCEKGKALVEREMDWGKDLLLFEAEGTGSRIDVPLDIPDKGRYEIVARIAQAPDYGDYHALLDGSPTNLDKRKPETSEIPANGTEVFHNYASEIYVAVDRSLGWLDLGKGRHTLTFVCTGRDGRSSGYNLGINDVVLERISDAVAAPPQPAAPRAPQTEVRCTAAFCFRPICNN